MSEKFKLKYEVVAILKDVIQKGMEAFGLPISTSPSDGGWLCMESDQPAFRNADKAILFFLEKTERIGVQSDRRLYNSETKQFDVVDYWIEQQIWKIRIISNRTTEPITDDNIPLMTDDVASMLVGWFNRLGCAEFRKHNMANLFVQMKDLQTYDGKSEVPQWVTEFPLKIQVVKQFETEIGTAEPVMGGFVPIEGKADDGDGWRDAENGKPKVYNRGGFFGRLLNRMSRGLFTNRH